MGTEEDTRKNILIKMHEFYANEARHQRSMMWETVKWFTPVLVAIHGSWWWGLLTKFPSNQKYEMLYLVALAIGGITLSSICVFLLNRFYRSDLIYITMFAKTEDELDFDRRIKAETDRKAFSDDEYISYSPYIEDRMTHKTAKNYVKKSLPRIKSMYSLMSSVFWLFIFTSIIEISLILLMPSKGENIMNALLPLQLLVIIFSLAGAYFITFGLKVEKQYSDDTAKELEFKKKGLINITEVTQREGLVHWGLILLTLAAILQCLLLYLPPSS